MEDRVEDTVVRPPAARDTQGGRDAAFARYVLPEVDVLLRVAMTLTAQPADAQDLAQDTLLRAYKAIDRFDGRHPRAWLLTIMRRAERNRHRRRRPHLLDDPDADLDRLASAGRVDSPGSVASPEDLVVGGSFDHAVDAALDELPEKHRQVVRLVDIGGLSYAEAARLLDVPEGTVMSRLHRARRRIRTRLAAAGLEPGTGAL
ncbi:RNA polymerase sigma factor [Streptomyces sp. NHF165]|nr:RNA polymerase sigma factor [Streptomyces sp. NHF165]